MVKYLDCGKIVKLQLKQNLEKYIFWILFTSVNLVSLLFKLGKLDIVEYKYDQN